MNSFTQFDRPLRINTPLGPDALLLVGLRGHETLSRLFHFELELLADRHMRPDFAKLLGQPVLAEVTVGGVRRYFHGLVRKLTEGRQDETFTQYRAELAPQFWLWTRRVQSRIFQQISVPDVLRQVLAGLKFKLDLTGTYPTRDYCVQYHESDFDFASRLMEEEGLYYYFQHSEEGHELIITDSRFQTPDLPEPAALVFDPLLGGTRRDLRINDWEKSQEVASNRYTVRDFSFELFGQNLEAVEAIQQSVKAGVCEHKLSGDVDLERYDFPGGYAKRFDGVDPGGGDRAADLARIFTENKRTARVRIEEEACGSLTLRGAGNAPHFLPGHKFTLMRHFDADGAYLLTRVEHDARLGAGYRSSGEEQGLQYTNRFTCIPADLQYRPQRSTPRPQIVGMQSATVVGPAGQEIFCDKYGRIKVQFAWDRQGKQDGQTSCWIRVAQVWAGKRWGAFFWPRVGHEVLVAFEEGDPDQPVIVGSLYNAANMPPFTLPDKAAGCGIKSCSVGGDPAQQYNCLVFHDQPGDEHLQMHSETHEVTTSESSRFRRTPGPQVEVIGSLFGLGSGSGGGLLEWPMAAGEFAHADWAKSYGHMFPGSSKYIFGDNFSSTLLGESVSHTLGGANTNIIVDAEELLFGHLMEHLGPIGALLGGAGGRTAFIAGSNNALTYSGPALTVVRGESFQYKTEKFWTDVTPVGIAVKALAILITGCAVAGDLCAVLMAHTEEDGTKESPEWATLLATGLSSGLLAVLMWLETKQAKAQAAEAKAAEATKVTDDAAKLATQLKDVSDAAAKLVTTAEQKLQSGIDAAAQAAAGANAVALDAGRTDKVLTGDYSLTAKNLSITSRSDLPGAALTIAANGGPLGDGFLNLRGAQQVLMQSGNALVKTSTAVGTSAVHVGNTGLGTITLQQGVPDMGPAIVMDGVAQTLKLTVGPPGLGASIELSATGVTIKFAAWSIALAAAGITATVAENSIKMNPTGVTIEGLNITNNASVAMLVKGLQATNEAVAALQTKGPITQVQ